jgi:preprotein translocase subunit SecG
MLSILLGFLTVILVLTSLLLILLVLIQLPKKDAGPGVAFGGGTTEALFGAGSGNALTKITKYCAGLFMGLSLLLSVVNAHRAEDRDRSLELELERKAAEAAAREPAGDTGAVSAPFRLTTPQPAESAPGTPATTPEEAAPESALDTVPVEPAPEQP